MIILEDLSPEQRKKYLEERRKKSEADKLANEKIGTKDEVRYRCEQINVIKLNGVISAHSSIKTEYLLEIIDHSNALVTLIDSVYNFHMTGTEELVAFISSADQVKRRMHYSLDDRGRIRDILNKEEIIDRWDKYLINLDKDPYIQKLKQSSIEKVIEAGNTEFSLSNDILIKNSNSNLFNQIIFGQYLKHDFENFQGETISTQSHFFPNIQIDINCEIQKFREEEDLVAYIKKGKPLYTNPSEMMELYNKFYKEQIQFQFTDYSYDLNMHYNVSKKDNRITEANATISEAIKNNMESQVLYKLRRVNL